MKTEMNKNTDIISEDSWDLIIRPKTGLFKIDLKGLWRYRDLVILFVKRDFVTFYKQTILGPLWFIIQPIFTTSIFTIVFGRVAKISTDGIPHFLFYLSGIVVWRYFSNCLNKTSKTFIDNTSVFGKVYFPRLTVPISVVITNFIQFSIQFTLFLFVYTYYFINGAEVNIGAGVIWLPVILLQIALLAIGCGVLISAFTTKYRDLQFVLTFFVQLWMYASPIVYPLSIVPEKYQLLYILNPMVSVIECFRDIFFGISSIKIMHISVSWAITLLILFIGIVLFNRVEKTFMDTI